MLSRFSDLTHSILVGIGIALLAVLLQNGGEIIAGFYKVSSTGLRISKLHWTNDLSDLAPGHYYISVGRPRGPCDLKIDQKTIATTKSSEPGLRSALSLGSDFTIRSVSDSPRIEVVCDDERGFISGFTHAPTVLPYTVGRVVQMWRELTTLYLGALASLFFGFILFFEVKDTYRNRLSTQFFSYLGFATISFLYAISLAHLPRLFISDYNASVLHWIARTLFGFGFYVLIAVHSRWNRGLAFAHVLPFIPLGFAVSSGTREFDSIYNLSCLCFPFLSGLSTAQLYKPDPSSRSTILLRYIGSAWTLMQLGDLVINFINMGPYSAPAAVVLVTLAVGIIRRSSILRDNKLATSTSTLLQVIGSSPSIEIKLKAIGPLMSQFVHYSRYSVYIDAFVLGMHDRPFERFVRFSEQGYNKNTNLDKLIDFSEDRGLVMKKAIESGSPQFAKGNDNAWHSVIPLGKHAVITLSDDQEQPRFLAAESHEFLLRSFPALQMIHNGLADFAVRMAYALEVLRLVRGNGEWREEVGSIFLDVNGFDDQIRIYKDPFGKFLTKTYLPALCQQVRKWMVREGNIKGDSVNLVCIQDLMQEKVSVSEGTYRALTEILHFVDNNGADMCRSQGYDPIRLQTGVNLGTATVVCDEFNVRTTGNLINETARLQAAARVGTTFVSIQAIQRWPTDGPLEFAPEDERDLAKSRFLSGRTVHLASSSRGRNAA